MPHTAPPDHPLSKLFLWAVGKAFQEHREIYTPGVASHIAEELLPDFVHVDRIYRLRNLQGRRLEDVAEMVLVAHEKEGPERSLEVNRYIGDFVLFMGGFFPASLRRGRWVCPEPLVARVGRVLVSFTRPHDYYVAEGRNAYHRAAETARLFDPELSPTYDRLGRNLDRYQGLLSDVRELLEKDPGFRRVEGLLD